MLTVQFLANDREILLSFQHMWGDKISSLLHLFEDGQLNRRELVERLTKYTGSIAAAIAAIDAAGLAEAQTLTGPPVGVQVPDNDPAIFSQTLTISGDGPLFVYQSVPVDWATTRRPAVLVIHENRGLTEYIKDVTRRLAKAGYVAVAVDLLSRQGGSDRFADPEAGVAAYGRTRPEERRTDMLATLLTIRDQVYVRGDRLGVIGFCAGGGNVMDLALNTDALSAAVNFYGAPVPPASEVGRINTPILFNYAELDRNLTASMAPFMQALAQNQKRFEVHVYHNANHAFHNDTGPRYDAAAATDAWQKTLDFLNRYLNRA
ncbi:MAG: dienelactone hydrolase family protein [Bryobacteraceae bacterium]|nr:dienelactone hydrolase family protein [Bryobacteraceae bacterium]